MNSYIKNNLEEYKEKVYAGVLGKIIGVYLGRPFEGWTHDKIMNELGEIWYYVNDKMKVPLIVTDDDITGTFAFLRALEDYPDDGYNISAKRIGKTWLNYLVEKKTVLWWGGVGVSTEHTAYARLKNGIDAPDSGSIHINGKVVAEQIGSQIFIDGWAMVAPGDPENAVKMATEAAKVSHDGEGLYGAVIIAAMESMAFIESDLTILIKKALTYIPANCEVAKIIQDMIDLHKKEPDWKIAVKYLIKNYPYSRYGGVCPMVPNHGLIILALLYGEDDFQKSQMIANSGGWDTDCNAANVGCFMAIKNGLESINQTCDFRGPVADRLYLPTAEGGRLISDALEVATWITSLACRLTSVEYEDPKKGAKFHFEGRGSLQGFHAIKGHRRLHEVTLRNVEGFSNKGNRTLKIDFACLAPGVRAEVRTLVGATDEMHRMTTGYAVVGNSSLCSGQTVRMSVYNDIEFPVYMSLKAMALQFDFDDKLLESEFISFSSELVKILPQTWQDILFVIPDTKGLPVTYLSLEIIHPHEVEKNHSMIQGLSGSIHVDSISFGSVPKSVLWDENWYSQEDLPARISCTKGWNTSLEIQPYFKPLSLVNSEEIGFFTQGTREWKDYRVNAKIIPKLFETGGVVAYYQGLNRYISFEMTQGKTLQLIESAPERTVLAETTFEYQWDKEYDFILTIKGNEITGQIGDGPLLKAIFETVSLNGGGCGIITNKGSLGLVKLEVEPV